MFDVWDSPIHLVGDVFWAVGRERGTYLDGQTVKNLNVRTTRIFQLINGRWRQMHHHGSIEDAKLLGDYQNVVRSPSPKPLKEARLEGNRITTVSPKFVERPELTPCDAMLPVLTAPFRHPNGF